MSEEFRYFISNREKYKSGDLKCKIQDISRLQHQHWLIDRDWTDNEKKELGLSDDQTEFTKDEFNKIFSDLGNLMLDFSNDFILWGIDGTWMTRYIPKDVSFVPTDHCGYLQCFDLEAQKKIAKRYERLS